MTKNKLSDSVIRNMTFSYSNMSSFDTCRWGWKLNYIDAEDSEKNFFAEYGSYIHLLLEKFWKDELSSNELADYYEKKYYDNVQCQPPPYPAGMWDSYYDTGLKFFSNFPLVRDDYETVIIEGKVNDVHDGIKVVVKPDLLVRRKSDGKVILMDYKTSKPFRNGKLDMSKVEPYKKQLTLYAHFVELHYGIKIDEISLLFIRLGIQHTFELTDEYRSKTLKWMENTVEKIRTEEEFEADPSNKYFCDNLCGVRNICTFRK